MKTFKKYGMRLAFYSPYIAAITSLINWNTGMYLGAISLICWGFIIALIEWGGVDSFLLNMAGVFMICTGLAGLIAMLNGHSI